MIVILTVLFHPLTIYKLKTTRVEVLFRRLANFAGGLLRPLRWLLSFCLMSFGCILQTLILREIRVFLYCPFLKRHSLSSIKVVVSLASLSYKCGYCLSFLQKMSYTLCKPTQYLLSILHPPPQATPQERVIKTFTCRTQNQHEYHHTPFSFYRDVLSCALNPALIHSQTINPDARSRADRILKDIISVGSYSESRGIAFVRDSVCKFIARMDKVPEPCKQEVMLTEGAERAFSILIRALIVDGRDAIMLPAPHYSLHKDAIISAGGTVGEYRLNGEKEWDIDFEDLESVLGKLGLAGKRPKAIIIINPGNPTGYTFSPKTIAKVLEFAVSHRLLVIADEVFRENIDQDTSFKSCRSVLETLSPQMRQNCELISMHSVSKGMVMAPGLRGGYMYMHNISPFVMQQLHKFQTFFGCSNIIGQLMIDLMVNPFQGMSEATKSTFLAEHRQLKDSIKRRGRMLADSLGKMQSIKCPHIDGNMYLYPSIRFSRQAIETAQRFDLPVDQFYCKQIQQTTGTAISAGSIFGQPAGRYHFRLSPCILPEGQLAIFLQKLQKSNSEFHRKYAD